MMEKEGGRICLIPVEVPCLRSSLDHLIRLNASAESSLALAIAMIRAAMDIGQREHDV